MRAADYEVVVTHPEGYELDPAFMGDLKPEYDQMKAFEGADFIYAKNWASYTEYGKILSKDRSWDCFRAADGPLQTMPNSCTVCRFAGT